MGWDRLWWYQVGKSRLRAKNAGPGQNQPQTVGSHRAPTSTTHQKLAAHDDGALVARSQILFSGSTVTLVGALTNETGGYLYFSGMPPYAITFEKDGSETILLGDFSSSPGAQPACGDCVMHPGATIPYRSIPVTLHNPRPRWDGADWCVSSRSMTLDTTFYNRGEVPTVQIFDCPAPDVVTGRS